jgi:hypothetical protein
MRCHVLVALALAFGCHSRDIPQPSASAAGAKPPDAQLTQASGAKIALADVLHQHAQTIVVFYRGFY